MPDINFLAMVTGDRDITGFQDVLARFKSSGGAGARRAHAGGRAQAASAGLDTAVVGRQPFGGFGLSGLGTQAGGPEYLLHFVHPRSITENTLRRGFAPRPEG